MPQKEYDIRLRGRRKCSNCLWWEDGVCYFNYYPENHIMYMEDSWCPDWRSRRIANKEGTFLHDTTLYKIAWQETEF